jgi:hypothetical protein
MPTPSPTPKPAFWDVVASGPDFIGVDETSLGGVYSVIQVLELILKNSVLGFRGEFALRSLEFAEDIV